MTDSPLSEHLTLAFQQLRHGLLSYLYHKVGNRAHAEDLLQDVFVKALASNLKSKRPVKLKAWLYTIAKNSVIDFYRAQRPALALPEDLSFDDTDHQLAQPALSGCLLPLTHHLPEIYRDTLIATDFEGKPMKLLAAETKLSISAIKSRASRARQMLRQKLLECCDVELSSSNTVIDYQLHAPEHSRLCDNCG